VKLAIGLSHTIIAGLLILSTYGVLYFALTYAFQVEECAGLLRRLSRLRR